MPPKRKAAALAEPEEQPTKRVTRSSRAPLTLPVPDKPRSTRRTRATPAPEIQTREEVIAEKAQLPPRSRRAKATAAVPPPELTTDGDDAAEEKETNVRRRTRAASVNPAQKSTNETDDKAQPAPRSRRTRAASVAPQQEPVNDAKEDSKPLAPAVRRRTRATAIEESEDEIIQDPEPAVQGGRGRGRGRGGGRGRGANATTSRAATSRKPAESADEEEQTDAKPVKRRGRAPKAAPLPVVEERSPEPPVETMRASTSKITLESLTAADSSESDDELLLTPTKKVPRHVTPLRSVGPRTSLGTPRLVFDAVEVPTPSKRLRAGLTPKGISPRTSFPLAASPSKLNPVTNRQLPVRATTPTKSPRSPRRVAREPSPSEDDELGILPPPSPTKRLPLTPTHTPRKGKAVATPQPSPTRLPRALPPHLHSCLESQKAAVLRALQSMPAMERVAQAADDEDDEPLTNEVAYEQLSNLLKGTVERGEGNSCMLTGPKGSGKTQLVERAIAALSTPPIVIRLSGHAQTNDRLAIREIAWQLAEQTGSSLLPQDDEGGGDDTDNPFVDNPDTLVALPPPSHLLALISMIPTLPRPTIVVIDAFDLFALHARQSLLYCLLDTVQSCRVGAGSKGIAVIGVTPRVDTINMLEKRVKSRFSGRMLRTAGPPTLQHWIASARAALCASPDIEDPDDWTPLWESAVDRFLQDSQVVGLLRETFSLTKDLRVLGRVLTASVLSLKPTSPYPTAIDLAAAVSSQRCPMWFPFLNTLTYPAVCLLIAATHARTSGHDAFTFEMLHEAFRDQVRLSLSAPVQVEGGGIGMVRCSREVLAGAFEKLVSLRVFVATAAPAAGTGREFAKYRCVIDRADVKKTVDKMGQHNLKKWLNKAQ